MPISVPYSGGLGLSIYGANSPTGHLGLSNSLYLQSNFSSGNLNLFTKNTPTLSGALKSQTNWDVSLLSNPRLANSAGGSFSYSQNDYSSNRFDSYYSINRGGRAIEYTIDSEWRIDDIAIEEGVMAVGVKDWTSFEKIGKKSDASVYSTYISGLKFYPMPQPTIEEVTLYTYTVNWTTSIPYAYITTPGTLTLGYTDEYGDYQTITGSITNLTTGTIGPITSREYTPDIISFNGDPAGWPTFANPNYTLYILSRTTSVVTITIPIDLPPDAIIVGNRYFRTSELTPMLSNLIIPELNEIFQDPNRNWMDQNSPNFEVPDYSDIYLDIVYSSGPIEPGGSGGHLFGPIVSADSERKVYKFGGFYKYSEFAALLKNPATTEEKTNIDGDDPYLWYIVTKDDGTYSTVMLSDYVTWSYLGQFSWNFPFGSDLFNDPYAVIMWKEISIKSLTVSKVIGYPSCGKVDLYFYKYGNIDSFSSDIITSINHQLSTGDCIKITECLSTSTSFLTNLNGIFFVQKITEDTFYIYTDSELTNRVTVQNTKSGSGRWAAISGETWKYQTTLFSPCGKNGYAFSTALRSVQQTPPDSSDPFYRAVDPTTYDLYPDAPQSDFTGQRSWNNFYPFERFSTNEAIIYGVVNGNNFGASLQIKKYNDKYILMVSEPGAEESFQICNDFILNEGETLPQNKFVIPNYLPYGRVHFFEISSDKSITYLTTCSTFDNPWTAYEVVNRQEKLIGQVLPYENSSLTFNDVKSYNTTTSNYWNGARFYSWQETYSYNSTYDINLPDQTKFPLEYGFVDSLGKAADFEIDGANIKCFATTNVKSADFLNNIDINTFNMSCKAFSFNISSPATKTTTNLQISSSSYTNNNVTSQKQEIELFGNKVLMKNNQLALGWPTRFRDYEYIYLYDRSGDDYILAQKISSAGSRNFGSYFDFDENLLVANKYYYVDDSSLPTNNPLQSIETYRYDINSDRYYYISKVTPTIDLSNPIYSNINPDQYELTTSISYDNSSGNSATYIIDLSGKFALKKDTLVIRDWNEYSVFSFNYGDNKFYPKAHKFSLLNTDNSLIKLSKNVGLSFFDASGEWDTGQSSEPLNIFDVSRAVDNSFANYLITIDTHYLNGLNLFLKTLEGYSSGNFPLYHRGFERYSGNSPLYLQAPIPSSISVNLFAKQTDLANSGINLFHKSTSLSSGDLNLFVRNGFVSGGLPLSFGSFSKSVFPLYTMNKPSNTYFFTEDDGNTYIHSDFYKDSSVNLYINSYITSIPNSSGYYNLYLNSIEKDGFATSMNLHMSNEYKLAESGISLYQNPSSGNSGTSFKGINLYTSSSGNQVYDFSTYFNLIIKCPETKNLPLVVYNTMATGNLNMSVSGANYVGSGISLFSSGVDYPNKNMNMIIRGEL